MVFYVTPGINADHMVAKNGRLCRAGSEIPKLERDTAPLGDNRNRLVYGGDRVTFPVLFKGKGNPPASVPLFGKAAAKAPAPAILDAKPVGS
jgi:hypothetical protein